MTMIIFHGSLCKAVLWQAWTGPQGSEKLRPPDFVTTAQYGGRLSALRTGRLYPPGIFLVLIFTRGWVDPWATVLSEGKASLKNPVTPPGIDPRTIRLVAQRLNHYAIEACVMIQITQRYDCHCQINHWFWGKEICTWQNDIKQNEGIYYILVWRSET